MSNDIDKNVWRIQEKALKPLAPSQSTEEQAAIKEYQELYQLLEHIPAYEPPSVLAQAVSRKIAMRNRKQRTGKALTAGLCLLLVLGLMIGLVLLLPQSTVLAQISESIPLPLLIFSFLGICTTCFYKGNRN